MPLIWKACNTSCGSPLAEGNLPAASLVQPRISSVILGSWQTSPAQQESLSEGRESSRECRLQQGCLQEAHAISCWHVMSVSELGCWQWVFLYLTASKISGVWSRSEPPCMRHIVILGILLNISGIPLTSTICALNPVCLSATCSSWRFQDCNSECWWKKTWLTEQ